eukprot:TRINITY_DN618_c0_g1_i4.p1 TRINITY_DN618_c0_g1~~TRINITY_DN618_c0_g1_i4.p1  ORF type:complete len:437 (+),score=50.80 TRINITY_DN618_c0_g1_i4:104-1414(+)
MRVLSFLVLGAVIAVILGDVARFHATTKISDSYLELGPNYPPAFDLSIFSAVTEDLPWFAFLPQFVASLAVDIRSSSWDGLCLRQVSALAATTGSNSLSIDFSASNPANCTDLYLLASKYSMHFAEIKGDTKVEMKMLTTDAVADIEQFGLKVFAVETNMLDLAYQFWETYRLFQDPTNETAILMLKQTMGVEVVPRNKGMMKVAPEDLIPGDTILTWSVGGGPDPLIMWGTGSRNTHTYMILNVNETMQICDSSDYNIRCMTYQSWYNEGLNNPYVLLRLRPDLRTRFNNTAAVEFLTPLLGLPYGYQNFLFGWLDTPDGNFPFPMTSELLSVGLSLASQLFEDDVMLVFGEGLNQRIGVPGCCTGGNSTTSCPACLTIDELFQVMAKRNLTLGEVISMPEQICWSLLCVVQEAVLTFGICIRFMGLPYRTGICL